MIVDKDYSGCRLDRFVMIVDKDYSGCRLDRFVFKKLNIPHALISRLLRKGKIKLNGKKAEISSRIEEGDKIEVLEFVLSPPKEAKRGENFVSSKMIEEFKSLIIFENEDFFVINKPSGLATQGGSGIKLSVDDFLFKLNSEYRLVHRLDRETSGILLIAKNRAFAMKTSERFSKRNISKTYLALTLGIPNPKEGILNSRLIKNNKLIEESKDGKQSVTQYKTLAVFDDFALLEVNIETGRMHQIRVHLSSIGCKIVGDEKYGDASSKIALTFKSKMFLHAFKLSFDEFEFTADPPQYFAEFTKNILDKSLI